MTVEALREEIAGKLIEGGDFTPGLAYAYADLLAPLVRNYAGREIRRFYLDAADEALTKGRRGPNAIADWLLDFGHPRYSELMDT